MPVTQLCVRWPRLSLTFVTTALASCGGGRAAPVMAPGIPGVMPERMMQLEAQQHDFDVSAAQFEEQLARRNQEESALRKKEAPADAAGAATAPPVTTAGPKQAEKSAEESREGVASGGTVGSSCDLLCRAFSSMQRSADAICSLTNELHDRCVAARRRVQVAQGQLAGVGCLCSQ